MQSDGQIKRREFKYYVPVARLADLRARLLAHMEHDPYCQRQEGHAYSVRSIYFDTPRLLFYYEKIEGRKVRKKLRVRAYNSAGESPAAFLEIKRKLNDLVYKERAGVPLSQAANITNGASLELFDQQPTFLQKSAVNNFIYLTKKLKLNPSVLVTYEREAFMGLDDSQFRVTLDSNVRSYVRPEIEDLFREEDLRTFADPWVILEVKFDGPLPLWTREILRDFKLRQQPISKYCWGLDAWRPGEDTPGPG